jgi:hypothetical protein
MRISAERLASVSPSPTPLGKVARSAGWGVARCFGVCFDCTNVTANPLLIRPAFRTPSGPIGRSEERPSFEGLSGPLPRFAEKGESLRGEPA